MPARGGFFSFRASAARLAAGGLAANIHAMLTRVAISGYRSVRNLPLELDPVTVFVGANGSGKSNLYRALRLFADAELRAGETRVAGRGRYE
jgi:predicted ATPase